LLSRVSYHTLFVFRHIQPSDEAATADVDNLQKRIQALEVGAQYDATKAEVQKVEQEFLLKLREIRAAIAAEAGAGVGGTSSVADTKELEALRAANLLLTKRNAKLEYRVVHVTDALTVLHDEHKHLLKKTQDIFDSRASF
jgi:predicted  nucleic acid-binding Zn-ribbon protein